MKAHVKNFFVYLENERGLSARTLDAYQRDLNQFLQFLSTEDICWVRIDELHFKMNPQIKYEKYPEFSADYYPDENFIEIDRICETELKREDGEVRLTNDSGETISMPFLSGKTKTYPPNKSLVKKIKELGIKVRISK